MAMTKDELRGFIAEVMQSKLGASPEEVFQAFKKHTEAAEKARIEENVERREAERRNHTPGAWDPQDRSHPYVRKAGHLIRTDSIPVQRVGSPRDSLGRSEGSYAANGAGFRAARLLRAYRTAELERCSVDDVLKKWDDDWLLRDLNEAREDHKLGKSRALGYSGFTSGGALVPLAYMQELIELLRATNVVRSSGVRQMPMPSAQLIIPRQTGSATATYVGESTAVNATQQSLDQITLAAKKLMAITAITNELMRTADPAADAFVRDDLIQTASNREDLAFLRGDGTGNSPRGLRYMAAASNITSSASGSSVATMLADTQGLFTQLAAANIDLRRPAFFMAPRSLYAMMFARDGTAGDGLILREEISSGRLFGVPLFTTSQIPVNLGGGSESEMYLVETSQVIIGDHLDPEITISDGAAYVAGGSVVSGFARDETAIRLKLEHDIVARHPEAIAVKTAVDF